MPSSPISLCPSCPPHPSRGHCCAMYPSSSLTDAQWAILEPLLPPPGNTAGRGGRTEKHCRRMILDAIFYLVRGGIAWRQLPAEYPPPMTVYAVFARWVRGGAWQRMHDMLRDRTRTQGGRDRCPTAAVIDSQTVPAADTVPRSSRGWDGAKRTNGRKRHIAVDVNGLLLAVVVTAASIQDRDAAHRLLAALRVAFSTIRLIWADGGYPGRLLVWAEHVLALRIQIIKRKPGSTGFHVRPHVWVVERTFAWISKHRRCVRDYETRPDHHEAMVRIAMIVLMTRRLART
ncbi:IS5 family transposase [Rhodococcus qingshengii]|uniref:Putative transposase n=1 Tax=Rhodococcus sp. DFA3 TaxID=279353 RepID=Q60G68_9NOCA|nr:IS5 family transposase [Rhodococcus qingshengii]MCZ4618759.1 IS5 family transposase [Rhodococcus qingshengii]BAD51808.1 putative transposase [Rhodococcus sp. DFA3]